MAVLLWGCVSVVGALGLHLALWRLHRPRRQTRALLVIFFGVTAAVLVALAAWPAGDSPWLPAGLLEYAHIALFAVAFALAYIITYSAIEADSPSLVIVMEIAKAGKEGISEADFEAQLSDAVLIEPRVADLVRDRMLTLEKDRYCLTAKGRSFVRIFILFRALLGAGKGG
jgi:hypothetical protein